MPNWSSELQTFGNWKFRVRYSTFELPAGRAAILAAKVSPFTGGPPVVLGTRDSRLKIGIPKKLVRLS